MAEASFIYNIICVMLQSMTLVSEGFCLEKLLTGREEHGNKKLRIMSWGVWGSVFIIIKCILPVSEKYIFSLHPIMVFVTHITILLYFYSDRLFVRLIHAGILMMHNILAHYTIKCLLSPVQKIGKIWLNFNTIYMMEYCAMVAVVSIFLNMIYTLWVLKFRKNSIVPVNPLWVVMMVQLLFAFAIICVLKWSHRGRVDDFFYAVYMGGMVVLAFGMFLLISFQLEKYEIRDKMKKLQIEAEYKREHYNQMEVRRLEMDCLRHEYQNVLSEIKTLIDDQRLLEAEKVISDLSVQIRSTKEYEFCGIPVVNAILTEKKQRCDAENISFNVNLELPNFERIEELDLCMIFGNLLDNAIRACKAVKAQGKWNEIVLSSGVVKEYLIIKCRNTALDNPKHKVWGTGYGHKILGDIAQKYDGDFQINQDKGLFVAQISLRIRK